MAREFTKMYLYGARVDREEETSCVLTEKVRMLVAKFAKFIHQGLRGRG